MMMFLAGSGVSTLAHSTRVDLGAVFIDQTAVAIYVCQSQPKTCPPIKFISVQRGNVGDSHPKTLSWMESICFNRYAVLNYGERFDPSNRWNTTAHAHTPQPGNPQNQPSFMCVCLTKVDTPWRCINDCEIC